MPENKKDLIKYLKSVARTEKSPYNYCIINTSRVKNDMTFEKLRINEKKKDKKKDKG